MLQVFLRPYDSAFRKSRKRECGRHDGSKGQSGERPAKADLTSVYIAVRSPSTMHLNPRRGSNTSASTPRSLQLGLSTSATSTRPPTSASSFRRECSRMQSYDRVLFGLKPCDYDSSEPVKIPYSHGVEPTTRSVGGAGFRVPVHVILGGRSSQDLSNLGCAQPDARHWLTNSSDTSQLRLRASIAWDPG